jgi:hypothetical protein
MYQKGKTKRGISMAFNLEEEDELQAAFNSGYQSCLNEYGWHFLKDGDTPPQEDKEYLFYFASKGERGMIISDTWERKRNNPYVIAWAEFQTLKV